MIARTRHGKKLLEIMKHGYNHADYIEVDEAKCEFAVRFAWLAQAGWPQFFQKEIRECNAHLKLDILIGMNHSAVYEVIKA